jgi:hypothetical protein
MLVKYSNPYRARTTVTVRRAFIATLSASVATSVCAEDNGDHFGKNLFPVPQVDRPDF